MSCLHVSSEIGSLQSVLVHTPGPELQAVTPGTREDYLYDDIIDLETAQREHRQFVAVRNVNMALELETLSYALTVR